MEKHFRSVILAAVFLLGIIPLCSCGADGSEILSTDIAVDEETEAISEETAEDYITEEKTTEEETTEEETSEAFDPTKCYYDEFDHDGAAGDTGFIHLSNTLVSCGFSYDCDDKNAVGDAYRIIFSRLFFGFLMNENSESHFAIIDDNGQKPVFETRSVDDDPDPLHRFPTSYPLSYSIYDGAFVDTVLTEIFNVEPLHDNKDLEDKADGVCYYHNGDYYSLNETYGGLPPEAEIVDYTVDPDDVYTFNIATVTWDNFEDKNEGTLQDEYIVKANRQSCTDRHGGAFIP